jgi:hypothetical protein
MLSGMGYPTGKKICAGTGMAKNLNPHAGMSFLAGRVRVGECGYGTALPDGFLPLPSLVLASRATLCTRMLYVNFAFRRMSWSSRWPWCQHSFCASPRPCCAARTPHSVRALALLRLQMDLLFPDLLCLPFPELMRLPSLICMCLTWAYDPGWMQMRGGAQTMRGALHLMAWTWQVF